MTAPPEGAHYSDAVRTTVDPGEARLTCSQMSRPRWTGWVLLALATGALTACSTNSAGGTDRSYGAPTSEMAVRGFLDGANADDYTRMSDLFGNDRGPAIERLGVTNVEQRMIFLSSILKHSSYELRQANLAQLGPDRIRWEASMAGTRKGQVVVPIITVPDGDGRWYVERLNLDALTASSVP